MSFCQDIRDNFRYDPMYGIFELRESPIHGLGIFVKGSGLISCDIATHYDIGGQLVRTPIGGFINHSDSPNCYIEFYETFFGGVYILRSHSPLYNGQEITLDYNKEKICSAI